MSTTAKALRWGSMLPLMLLVTRGAPLTAVAIPFAMVPTGAGIIWRRNLSAEKHADLDLLTYIYFGSGTLGLVGVLLVQSLLAYAFAYSIFGSETSKYLAEFTRTSVRGISEETKDWRWTMSRSWKNQIFLVGMTYVMAGGVEELMKVESKHLPTDRFSDTLFRKYLPIAYLRKRLTAKERIPKEVYVQYATAASLGFSTIENLLYAKASVKAGEQGSKLALTIFERVIVGSIGHTLSACLIAINAANLGDYRTTLGNLWRILGFQIFWHGTSDLLLMTINSLNGNIGWIHPNEPWQIAGGIALIESMQLGLFLYARRAWRSSSG